MSAVIEQANEFEQSAISVRDEAKAIAIIDQQTYDTAAAKFNGVCALEKEITAHYAPMKEAAHKAHKAVCDAEKQILSPVQEAKRILSRSIGEWDEEQERVRREEQRRLEIEAKKRADEEALASAIEAEQSGADAEEIEAVLSSPAPIQKVTAAPTYSKQIPTRESWSAEVVSLSALVKAAAANPAYLCYLQANETALNGAARAQKNVFSVPGCKAMVQRIATRGR
jgi:uncharacterized protein YhaN